MKVLIVSDTHGAINDSIVRPMKEEKGIDLLIHCGDKYRDTEKLADLIGINNFYRVPGNCDYDVKDKKCIMLLEIEGKRVLITHGHMHNVKDGLDMLKKYARENCADLVLFGHTHKSYNEIDNNILYFNPGSTILPKDGKASFGVITIEDGNVTGRIVNM